MIRSSRSRKIRLLLFILLLLFSTAPPRPAAAHSTPGLQRLPPEDGFAYNSYIESGPEGPFRPATLPAEQTVSSETSLLVTPHPEVAGVINQINPAMVSALVANLSGEIPVEIGGISYTLATRYTPAEAAIYTATQYTYEYFTSLGLETRYHEYILPGSGSRRNVIAEQPGSTHPEQVYLLTAHLDSTSRDSDPKLLAPGADDNASGSAGVLVAAQVLRQLQCAGTLRYALFTGEEQGLVGSEAYADDVNAAGEDILAVINLDMIAYNSDASPVIELHTRPEEPADLALATTFSQVIAAYGLNLTPQFISPGTPYSDHASFWEFGYPAILAIEDYEDFTPFYHTSLDQLETLDLAYFTAFVQAAVGSLAHLACRLPPDGELSGIIYSGDSSTPLPEANVTASNAADWKWSTTGSEDGAYSLVLPADTYMVTITHSGYLTTTINNVLVQEDTVTTLDASLYSVTPEYTWLPLVVHGP